MANRRNRPQNQSRARAPSSWSTVTKSTARAHVSCAVCAACCLLRRWDSKNSRDHELSEPTQKAELTELHHREPGSWDRVLLPATCETHLHPSSSGPTTSTWRLRRWLPRLDASSPPLPLVQSTRSRTALVPWARWSELGPLGRGEQRSLSSTSRDRDCDTVSAMALPCGVAPERAASSLDAAKARCAQSRRRTGGKHAD